MWIIMGCSWPAFNLATVYVSYITLGWQKFLHPMGSQEVTSWKTSDNRGTIAGRKMVPNLGARWPKLSNFKVIL